MAFQYFMLAKDYRKFRAQVLAFIHDYRLDNRELAELVRKKTIEGWRG